jgi:dTDP-4-amino-4,6-dideoxygalactose transaminase
MKKIPFLRPNLVKKEALIPYLSEIEDSRIYSNFGPLNTRFEKRVLDEYFDHHGAVTTVNNATIGLITAISQCKRPKGKYALMPSFTFSATPLAAMWCGLIPFFIDVRSDDWCMDEELLKEILQKLGSEVAVVIPYATFGTNLNLDFYKQIHQTGVPIVIDAAASFGAINSQHHFGKGFPGCVVYSFHATKSFGVGEGGLVYSANTELIGKIRQAENFGFSMNRETTVMGINAKLTEYSAAIALSTLDVFEQKMKVREQIYTWYLEEMRKNDLFEKGWTIQEIEGNIPHQFMPICCPEVLQNSDVVHLLENHSIEARTYFSPPCHQHPLFSEFPHTPLPVTEKLSSRILSLPLWEEMSREKVMLVVEGLTQT